MNHKNKIAIVGLGYVGLPLARLFATKYPVVGFDIKLDGESKSSALINIETDFGMKEFIFDKIGKIAAEKDLLMINEV